MKLFKNITIGIIAFDELFVIYQENNVWKSTSKALTLVFRLYDQLTDKLDVKVSREGEGISRNGVFNGLFGFIQRKEIDINIFPVSFSAIDIPECNYSIPLWSNALKIMTFPEKKSNMMIDLLTLTAIVPRILTGLLVILILMLSLLITIKVTIDENILRTCGTFIKNFFNNLWLIYSLFWRESSFKKSHYSIVNILIILFHFFNLFLFAYFTSVFSTNLVVSVRPFQVDSFDDIFDPRMANHRPIIRRSSFLVPWILDPTSNSIRRLRDLIIKFGFENCFIPDDYKTIFSLRDLKNSPKFAIMSEYFATSIPKFIYAYLPDFPYEPYISKEILFPNLLALTYVNRYDNTWLPKLQFLHLWFMKYFESGLSNVHLIIFQEEITKNLEDKRKKKDSAYNDIKTGNVKLLFLSLSVAYLTICIIWIIDKIMIAR